jgi:hypothetical protein
MALHEWTRPLDTTESGALLKVAMGGAERSAFRLWCRLVDMAELEPEQLAADAPPESLVDLAGEIELTMQVLDMAYRRLSIAYFNAVGPDDPPGLDASPSRQ